MAMVRIVNKKTGEELFGDAIDLETGESQSIAAAKSGNVGDLKLLHDRHANFDYQDPDGWTALMTACATHHVDCALYLISCNVNLELAAKDGWTALMIAIDHNQEEIVKALLDAGAKTGKFNYSGACELCIAAKYPRLAELLLEHGANPNQPHPKLPLVKPLFLTLSHCKDAHPDFVRTLVKHGAEVNAQTKEGQTPLMVSVMNAGITKALLECGADSSLRDQDGETALDYAKKPGVDPRAYEILNTAMQKMDDDRNAKDTDASIIAERVGKRYDEICAYFSDNPFGSNPSDLTILSLLPPIDRCLIIERILKLNNSDRLTCIDKLSMAYLKAGLRDVAFEFIKQCDKCGWFNNQPNRYPYPQWDYDFFSDKLNGLVVGNVSVCYDDTLRKFPDYDSGSRFCGLVKQLSIEYKGREVLKGDESPEVLKKFHAERLAYIKGLTNKSNPIEVNSAKGEQTAKQEIGAGVGNPLNEAMQNKDIERKTSTAIDKTASPAEIEKSAANEAIFTSETNCTINVDDIKSLTIFCDKYGATLTVGDTQLIAWYKVDIKAGKQAKGAYAFEGYAYISGKDFLKLKPILLKRGWEFHSAKSGSPWFAEGESAVCPKEVEVTSQTLSGGQSINNGVDKGGCVGKKEDTGEPVMSDKPQSPKDEKRDVVKNSAKRGCLIWLCLISVSAVVGCAVWLLKDGLPEVFSESFSLDQNKDARQGNGQELRDKAAKTQHEVEERRTSEQEEQFRKQAEQTRIEHEVQREREQAARIKREEEAKRLFEQRQALQKQLKHKEIAEQQKGQMIVASQSAEEAGAKAHAVSEWNNGIAAWKLGDDMFKTKSYELARGHYSEAANYFKAAELTASKAEAKNLLASLPDLEVRAVNLIRDNERWFKWSVDASALVSMGNELCKEYKKVELLVSKGVLANFGDTKSKLGNLILRCYELAADAGNTMAMLKLAYWSENGKMCPKNSEKAVGWYVKAARAKNGDAMYRLGYFYSEGLMGLEKSEEKSYLMFRSAKVNGCTFKNVDAWLNSLPNRNPHGYKVFLWGGMNVELDIDDLLDEIEARVK